MRCAFCGSSHTEYDAETHRLHTRNCIKRQYCERCGWHKSVHTRTSHLGFVKSAKKIGILVGPTCRKFREPPRRYRVHGRRKMR